MLVNIHGYWHHAYPSCQNFSSQPPHAWNYSSSADGEEAVCRIIRSKNFRAAVGIKSSVCIPLSITVQQV